MNTYNKSPEFNDPLRESMEFNTLFKTLSQKGNLVYEYNPLRNYRLSESAYYYKNRLFSEDELRLELGISKEDWNNNLYPDTGIPASEWPEGWIPSDQSDPILLEAGELTDFETSELSFDLKHPVDIVSLYSYDGSVNLILNDGTNQPRLINSRFSPIGRNKYLIVDRKGDNDTNIYDLGEQFDIDTSLYKRTTTIPNLVFTGLNYSGNLSVGNYHFYFKYLDADGNETDFIAESGLVSIFIGNEPYNIYSGFRDLNAHKGCTFLLTDLDTAYQYVSVYYTKNTSDINQNATTKAYKINLKFIINDSKICNILISGFEDAIEISLDEINPNYQVVLDAFTQDSCQNMLFLANVHKTDVPYTELLDISLRILPRVKFDTFNIGQKIDKSYNVSSANTYYNPDYIYSSVGYWPDEIYRFGVVYILSDNTLSPVFNVRGADLSTTSDDSSYTHIKFLDTDGNRKYISFDELTYLISDDEDNNLHYNLENAKGVIHTSTSTNDELLSIVFDIGYEEDRLDIINKLKELKIKGFFFVRLKRIPTTLCLAFSIGVDKYSHLPAVPNGDEFIIEKLLDDDRKITHNFTYSTINSSLVDTGAICPEYDVNPAYYNTLFCGDTYKLRRITNVHLSSDESNERHFYQSSEDGLPGELYADSRIIGIEDNVKLVGIGSKMFSARAGEAEEGFRYEYIGYENKTKEATNIARGSYGPYLGFDSASITLSSIFDIKIPNFNRANMSDYFAIRYLDKSSYLAISDRFGVFDLDNTSSYECFRGDCYICLFTHRINRNFSDPSSPTNDKIIDENCWKDHYDISDGVVKTENFEEINLGDLNAKKMGSWITIWIRSTRNLCVRSLDDSIPDEIALYGQARAFYPYQPMRTDGVYKIPEALCYNDGFSKGLSCRYNFEVPDVPYIKNDFSNRILYSDIHVNDAFTNGFRTFLGTHYRDYPKTYGSITKIIEFRGNLVCVFEHGVALIPVNERAVAGEGAGGNVYINTSNVLPENPKIISDTFGSLWRESVIKTPTSIYGVDTVGKKIWRTNGETFECISDFRVQEFLNQNISLTERELEPIVGIRNVKTHYNRYKHDVMFTFYDNLYGFEETAWNLCWNEDLQKFISFYSWIPSYSENIYNLYFSFDRNTSKWIAKLGTSHSDNDFSDGVVLSNNIILDSIKEGDEIGNLSLANRNLPTGNNISYNIIFSLERDNYGNYKYFEIVEGKNGPSLALKVNKEKLEEHLLNLELTVIYLNVKALINVDVTVENAPLEEAYITGFSNKIRQDETYYQSTIALITKKNLSKLTTDFWKHGQAGIIDIADKICPTYWYGKLHPFEFEFVVADNPNKHKIFDNLLIISNNAEPESFHYEIVGDCYDFAKDKKNMYIRLEATKELYQYNGSDITYDHDYSDLESVHRSLKDSNGNEVSGYYDRSTLMPLYYSRLDTINDIEDRYHLKDGANTKDFSALAGGEVVHYKTLDEYRIWNHAKAVDMQTEGRLRGNMLYNEDKWLVQINPINIVYKNESKWVDLEGKETSKIPVELGLSPIPKDALVDDNGNPKENIEIPLDFTEDGRGYVTWKWSESQRKEVKLKDKWIKIRIRYSGKKLAVITAIKTLFSISY